MPVLLINVVGLDLFEIDLQTYLHPYLSTKSGKCEAVHPQSPSVMSLSGTCKGKEEERRHHIS